MNIFAVLIFLTQTIPASPTLSVSDRVQVYKQRAGHRQHRSGLDASREANYLSAENLHKFKDKDWINNITIDSSTKSPYLTLLKAHLIQYGFKEDGRPNSYSIDKEFKISSNFDTSNIQLEGQKYIKALFPQQMWDQIDVHNYSIEYTKSAESPTIVTGYNLYFVRVFEGRIIRDISSMAMIRLNGQGQIKTLEISWPALRTSSNRTYAKKQDSVSYANLISIVATMAKAHRGRDTIDVSEIQISGMSDAWCYSDINKEFLPCEAYQLIGVGEGGSIFSTIIDTPISENVTPKVEK